jgi:ADP-ribose pyrophosphatase
MPLEPPQLLRRKLFYQGRKFSFEVNRYRLPNKVEGEMECIRHPGGALIVPVTSDGQLMLLRQYRFSVQRRILEFPAGTVEIGEDPATTAEREVQEETGFRAANLKKIGEILLAPGYSDEVIYIFLATGLEKLKSLLAQDDDEDIEVLLMSLERVAEAIASGELTDAKTIAAFAMVRSSL